MQINNNNISLADEIKKSVSINQLFDYLGIKHPDKNEYLIKCPWRLESNGSLSIFIGRDGIQHWKDHGSCNPEESTGSVIDAYMKIEGIADIKQALWNLKNRFFLSFKTELTQESIIPKKERKIKVEEVKDGVLNSNLLTHLREIRNFPDYLFQEWLSEIRFKVKTKDGYGGLRYGFGIRCGSEDWSIRTCFKGTDRNGKSINNKLSTGQNFTLVNNGFAKLLIVEGMCDFLAYMALFPKTQANVIILNSTENVDKVISYLHSLEKKYIKIGLCLDRDRAGTEATEKLLRQLPDYPKQFAQMAQRWLESNPDANEWEKSFYQDACLYDNEDIRKVIWNLFKEYDGIEDCGDICEVWQLISKIETSRKSRIKSCEHCISNGYCNNRKGLMQIKAHACPSYRQTS